MKHVSHEGSPAQKTFFWRTFSWQEIDFISDSDVDLFVVKDTSEPRMERTKRARNSIWGIGFPVDLLVYTPNEIARRFSFDDPFFRKIFDKGKIVYER